MNDWWEAFWFFLPAGFANMAPVVANMIPGLNRWKTPMDLGKSWRGKRLLGSNKTWRGIVFGTFMAVIIGLIQYRVMASSTESTGFIILVTALMGFGALLGDAVKSFFKRRRGVKSGDSWFPFDQIDYILGGLIFTYPLVGFSFIQALMIVIIYFGLHVVVVYIFYLAGIRKKPI